MRCLVFLNYGRDWFLKFFRASSYFPVNGKLGWLDSVSVFVVSFSLFLICQQCLSLLSRRRLMLPIGWMNDFSFNIELNPCKLFVYLIL